MGSKSVADWIQVAGNIGLIAGLVLVSVQIRESNQIASAEMFSASVESTVSLNTVQLGETPHESMTRVLYKPQEATVEDMFVADRIYDALLRILVRVHVLEDLGFYGSEEITSSGFVQVHYHVFACPYGLAWIEQALEKFSEPQSEDAPFVSSLKKMRKLAASASALDDFEDRQKRANAVISGLLTD